jgi:hypothetical protein
MDALTSRIAGIKPDEVRSGNSPSRHCAFHTGGAPIFWMKRVDRICLSRTQWSTLYHRRRGWIAKDVSAATATGSVHSTNNRDHAPDAPGHYATGDRRADDKQTILSLRKVTRLHFCHRVRNRQRSESGWVRADVKSTLFAPYSLGFRNRVWPGLCLRPVHQIMGPQLNIDLRGLGSN